MPEFTWEPDLVDVAHHLRTFTRDADGRETLTFTADTAPSADEVASAIAAATQDVAAAAGPVPTELADAARNLAALRAAGMAIIDRDAALSRDLRDEYRDSIDRFARHARRVTAGAGTAAVGVPASGNFPPPFKTDRTAF